MSLQYIIDGYNIIHHPIFNRTHKYKESPHLSLLAFIKAKRLTGSPKNKINVVFDGYPGHGGVDLADDNTCVVFSRKISADDKIKGLVEESAQRKNIVVVSDDREIQFMVKALGARCIGVEEFIGQREKSHSSRKDEPVTHELSYSSMHKINEELRKIWLK